MEILQFYYLFRYNLSGNPGRFLYREVTIEGNLYLKKKLLLRAFMAIFLIENMFESVEQFCVLLEKRSYPDNNSQRSSTSGSNDYLNDNRGAVNYIERKDISTFALMRKDFKKGIAQ